MKKYRVTFSFKDHPRYTWEGTAVNEFFALSKAYEEKINLPHNNQTGFWSDFDVGFGVKIEQIK